MTAKDLKASILQLAIQGKLVPQDPTDEPASVLLARIRDSRVEVEKCRKTGTRGRAKTPASPQPITDGDLSSVALAKEEKPFDLPEGWAWCRLIDVCHDINDGDHQPPPQQPSGVPFLVISNVSSGRLSFENTRYVSSSYFDTLAETRKAARGDLLVTVTGSYGIPIPIDVDVEFCFQRHIALLKKPTIDCTYLLYALAAPSTKKHFDIVVTGTAQKTIPLSELRKTLVPLPPLAEQKRIVAKIEELMPMVERYGAVKEQSDALEAALPDAFRKSVLQYAIQGKLVPQDPNDEPASALLERIAAARNAETPRKGRARTPAAPQPIPEDEQPFDLPEGWAWCRVGEIAEVQLGKMLDKDRQVGARYSYLANLNVRWHSFDLSELRSTYFSDEEAKKFTLCKGDILMCEGGVPGRCAIWQEESTSIKYQKALHRLRVKNVLPEYVVFFFEAICDSVNFKEVFTGTTIKHLPRERLISLLFPLPPLAEQKRIVAEVDRLLAMGEHLKVAT